jgi:RNA-binding motif X-linked protein 2
MCSRYFRALSWPKCRFLIQLSSIQGMGMSRVRAISDLNERELATKGGDAGSWHAQYKDSPYIYIGSLPYDLSEGDTVAVFSQYYWYHDLIIHLPLFRYGEVLEINLIRDKDTGKSKGFAFLRYADPRSTILAVDNLNGISVSVYCPCLYSQQNLRY